MSEEPVIRVVVIDDHEMILQSMVRLLRDDPQIAVVGTALTAEQGICVTQEVRPDIVIIDYSLTDMDAPEAIKILRMVRSQGEGHHLLRVRTARCALCLHPSGQFGMGQ